MDSSCCFFFFFFFFFCKFNLVITNYRAAHFAPVLYDRTGQWLSILLSIFSLLICWVTCLQSSHSIKTFVHVIIIE